MKAFIIDQSDVELAKVQLVARIIAGLEREPMSPDELATVLGVDASELLNLFHGRLATCSLDQLIRLLTRLGDDVHIHISPPLQRQHRGTLRVLQATTGPPEGLTSSGDGNVSPTAFAPGRRVRRRSLTLRSIDALQPRPKRYEVFDPATPGLALRVTPHGHKAWTLLYRHNGRPRRLTLGRYPDLGLAEARTKAIRQRGRIIDGADPAAEKRRERATYGNTISALYLEFKHTSERMKSWPELRRIYEREVLPAWGNRPVQDITRRDIRTLIEKKAETAPIMANRLLSRISRLFTFAVEREWLSANPALRMRRPSRETGRDRVLSHAELTELWRALHETEATDSAGRPVPRLSETLNDAFLFLLMTAQRGGEVWRMQWEHVDLRTCWWTIPTESSKNGDAHRVPLTWSAVEVLERRRRNRDVRYVFSNLPNTCIADRAKKAAAILCGGGVSFHFRAHDLRRTAASYIAEAGVDRLHIAHVLNHRSVTRCSVTAIYDRYRYDREKRAALAKWAEVLTSIVGVKAPARA